MIDKDKLKKVVKDWNKNNPDKRQLNQIVLAQKLGISTVTYRNYINNKIGKIPFSFVKKLCEILQVDESVLVKDVVK